MLALVLTLQSVQPPTPPWYGRAGRVLTTRTMHVGWRPFFYVDTGEVAAACTVQITAQVL